MPKTQNSIKIKAEFNDVFDITNDIENWGNLFTEYKEVRVLKKEENYILFQLTTVPDENQKSLTWISERYFDKENKRIRARRVEQPFPFLSMEIEWLYHIREGETELIWLQDFAVDPSSGYSDEQVITHLNQSSIEQLRVIKENIEMRFAVK